MNILILCTKMPYPPKDGGAIATLNLATSLSDTGNSVTLLSFNTHKHFFPVESIPLEILEKVTFHDVAVNTSIKPGKLLRNLLLSRKPYIAERFLNETFRDRLREILVDSTWDIVQLEGPYFLDYLPVIREHSSARIALRAHNVEHQIWQKSWKSSWNPLKRLYLKDLSRRIRNYEIAILRKVDQLVAISEVDREQLLNLQPGLPSITIPTGLDLSTYHIYEPQSLKSMLFIGALDWSPNIEALEWLIREVFPKVIAADEEIGLHVAGRNAIESLQPLLSQRGIHYHGEVNDAKDFISAYHVMAVPLFRGSGMRIKILEGLALGKCIVTTPVGAQGMELEDGVHLHIADNPADFASKLTHAIQNPMESARIGHQGREMVREKFDTFVIASKLTSFFNLDQ